MEQEQKHYCVQAKYIEAHNRALFGDPMKGEKGAIEMIKEIHEKFAHIEPSFNDVMNWRIFFKKGRELGIMAVFIITTIGIISGAIYTFKEWIKK